jgi:large subunit ribosomal protein L36e
MGKDIAGIAVGKHRGFITTKIAKPAGKKTGKPSAATQLARGVIREVAGHAPYEKRAMELLKVGREKRCLKLLKKRLGTHIRGKRKRDELNDTLRVMKTKH